MSKKINLLYQCSDAFSFLAGVSITSLLINNADTFLNIYIFGDKLSSLSINRFKEIENNYKEQCNFFIIDATACDKILEENNIRKWKNSYATYYKIFFHYLIPDLLEPIFYIDADTIILDKLDGLLDYDFKDNILSMLRVNTNKKHINYIGMKLDSLYFAGGIIYFNTEKWIKDNYQDKIIENLKKNNLDSLADQDIINYTLQDKILPFTSLL